jgi:hypothetical protein
MDRHKDSLQYDLYKNGSHIGSADWDKINLDFYRSRRQRESARAWVP